MDAVPTTLLPASDAGLDLVAKFFRALGDTNRLRLLQFLLDGQERSVTECVQHVGLSQGRVSVHLACLAECGYVSSRRQQRFVYYAATDPRIRDILELVTMVASQNAEALSQCMRIDGVSLDPAGHPTSPQ